MKILESEVFEFAAQLTHAEAMRNRRVNIHRLLRDATTLLWGEVFERAHVVQAICQLHQHYAHVINHREQHLAYVLCLLLLARDITDVRQLR